MYVNITSLFFPATNISFIFHFSAFPGQLSGIRTLTDVELQTVSAPSSFFFKNKLTANKLHKINCL